MNFWEKIGNGISNGYNWLKDQWNELTGITYNQQSVTETNQANKDIAADTNQINYDVAMQNLDFQKDLQEYNKALQQQLFEREDTSYQRTAQDMQAAGLNPISMQGTNGSGAVVSMSAPENGFQAQQSSPMIPFQKPNMLNEFINAVSSVITNVEELKTGKLTRDKLRTETNANKVNAILDNIGKGVFIDDDGNISFDEEQFSKWTEHEKKKFQEDIDQWAENQRNREHDANTGRYSSDSQQSRMITDLIEWLTGNRGKEAWSKLKKQYPLLQLFDQYATMLIDDPYYELKLSNGKSEGYWTERGTGRKYTKDSNGNKVYQ